MRDASARRGPSRSADAVEPDPYKGRILLIDDEEVIAATLHEFLEGEGYEVRVANDAHEALRAVEVFEPEIALCDIQLPGLDGLDLLDRMLRVRPDTMVMM